MFKIKIIKRTEYLLGDIVSMAPLTKYDLSTPSTYPDCLSTYTLFDQNEYIKNSDAYNKFQLYNVTREFSLIFKVLENTNSFEIVVLNLKLLFGLDCGGSVASIKIYDNDVQKGVLYAIDTGLNNLCGDLVFILTSDGTTVKLYIKSIS